MTDDELLAMAEDDSEFERRMRTMEDFRYDEQQEKYWDITTGVLLGAKSVDGAIPIEMWPTREDQRNGRERPFPPSKAINDVSTGLTVEGSTWWPGEPQFIQDRVITERGAMYVKGAVTYNCYVPADHSRLRTNQNPDKWIDHVKFLFPDPLEHEHFFDFAAHMIQRPDEKVNHGIVIAGEMGIGKDTALFPLRKGVGEHNAAEIDPDSVTGKYSPFLKSVMLIINEVRPHDEHTHASNFYNQMKPLLASPPDMLPMEVKYANMVYVRNLCHVILTTNDPLTMYIPENDRRLFVMTSPLPDPKKVPIFSDDYFDQMFTYLLDGGNDAVVRWLLNRDISNFKAGTPPPMTVGKRKIIDSSTAVRHSPLDDIIERYTEHVCGGTKPVVFFAADLKAFVNDGPFFDDKNEMLRLLNNRGMHFKMDSRGYTMVKNPEAPEWKNGKFRSRSAFVDKTIPNDQHLKIVYDALALRPLTFSFE